MRFNGLSSDVLQIDQVLKIPVTSQDNFISYVVLKGDSLYSISKKYGVSIADIKIFNNLTSDVLQIGQVLKIPVFDNSNDNNYISYTVKSGDSLYSISKKYGVSVADIINFNDLTSTILNIGQILKIPINNY